MKRLQHEDLESRIRRLLEVSGSSVKVIFENRFPGRRLVGGKYHPGSHTITLYRDTIREQCLQMFGTPLYSAAFTAVIFAHELGHAEDPELERLSGLLDQPELSRLEKQMTALKLEQNAWDFASRLLAERMPYAVLFQEIVFQSLEPYYQSLAPRYQKPGQLKKQPASA